MQECDCGGCLEQTDSQYCIGCRAAGFEGDMVVVAVSPQNICTAHVKKCGS
jgi:hypothetical protein